MPRSLAFTIATTFELAFMLAGLALLVRWFATGEARQHRVNARLSTWAAEPWEFFVFLALCIGGMMLAGGVGVGIARALKFDKALETIFSGGLGQVGLLVGVVLYRCFIRLPTPPEPLRLRGVALPGIAAFLIGLPLVTATSLGWRYLLNRVGFPVQNQELIGLFRKPGSSEILAVMTLLAVVVAPISEELVFRGGIFRFMRTHVRPWLAIVASSFFFAAIHVNVPSILPLFVLAIVFALAYERTGSLATPMIAHALFNLNTVVLVVTGTNELV